MKTLLFHGGTDAKPVLNKNFLRLYGHNLCVFSARARYALAAKGFSFQEVAMNYASPAKWHVELEGTAGGPQPILETWKGEIVRNTMAIANFAIHQAGPDNGIQL